jgi:hypothetical protein
MEFMPRDIFRETTRELFYAKSVSYQFDHSPEKNITDQSQYGAVSKYNGNGLWDWRVSPAYRKKGAT